MKMTMNRNQVKDVPMSDFSSHLGRKTSMNPSTLKSKLPCNSEAITAVISMPLDNGFSTVERPHLSHLHSGSQFSPIPSLTSINSCQDIIPSQVKRKRLRNLATSKSMGASRPLPPSQTSEIGALHGTNTEFPSVLPSHIGSESSASIKNSSCIHLPPHSLVMPSE
jgi:hypothetical protein